MSVIFIEGKPGGGKSYYATSLVLKELRLTDRNIVTNLSLNIPEVCNYLNERFGDTFNARHRIRLLSEHEVGEFYRFYAQGGQIEERKRIETSRKVGRGKGDQTSNVVIETWDYAGRVSAPGVLYVIDEVHIYFNSRRWADTGDDALYYLSQHRKLGDDVVCVTQAVSNVDKQFRSVTQEYHTLRNLGKERVRMFGGIIRNVPRIIRRSYTNPPNGVEKPMEYEVINLDTKGVCACYATAAGVGITGLAADTKERRGGLSPKWLILVFALICIVFFNFDRVLAFLVLHGPLKTPNVLPTTNEVPSKIVMPATNNLGVPKQIERVETAEDVRLAAVPKIPSRDFSPQENTVEKKVFLVGVTSLGKQVTIWLSDGRRFDGDNPLVTYVSKSYAVIGGKEYHFEYAPAEVFSRKELTFQDRLRKSLQSE